MEETRENPSLPSNYISILHLRDRWLKEKERNQKENEEEKEKQRNPPQENQNVVRKKLEETPCRNSVQNGTHQFQRYNRVTPASNPHAMKEKGRESVEADSEAPVTEMAGKKKKQKRYRKKNPRAENEEMEIPLRETECKIEKKNVEERRIKIAIKKLSRISVSSEIESGIDRGGDEAPAAEMNGKKKKKKWGKKTPRAENAEMENTLRKPEEKLKEEIREMECEVLKKNVKGRRIEIAANKLGHISLNSEIERRNHRGIGAGNRNFRDYRNPHRRGVYKPGMVWVRKDELSNGMIDESRVSINRKEHG